MSQETSSTSSGMLLTALAIIGALVIGGCAAPGDDNPGEDVTPGAFLLPKLNPDGFVQPTGISCDGSTVIGAALNADGTPEAFRWTETEGIVGMGFVPGFDGESSAVALSCDGSVIVGFSVNTDSGLGTAWTWTASSGMNPITISDPEMLGSTAVDLSEDGTMLLGIYSGEEAQTSRKFNQNFSWTADGGVRNWGGRTYLDSIEDDFVGLSGDGFTLVSNIVQVEGTGYQGANVSVCALPGAKGEWAGYATTPDGLSTPFWLFNTAVSRDGTVLGGSVRRTNDWATPGIWSPSTSQMQILPNVTGYVKSISPDGSIVGGGNDDPGTAFIWNQEHGSRNLVIWLERYDFTHGTDILGVFKESGGPSNVTGFAANSNRIVGTAGETTFGAPCYGFVMDLPPLS